MCAGVCVTRRQVEQNEHFKGRKMCVCACVRCRVTGVCVCVCVRVSVCVCMYKCISGRSQGGRDDYRGGLRGGDDGRMGFRWRIMIVEFGWNPCDVACA